jgi:hypothetical protein
MDPSLDGRISIPGRGKIFSLLYSVQTGSGPTQPPIQWAPEDLSPGVKRPGHEADYSLPSSAEIKNRGAITPLPFSSS